MRLSYSRRDITSILLPYTTFSPSVVQVRVDDFVGKKLFNIILLVDILIHM